MGYYNMALAEAVIRNINMASYLVVFAILIIASIIDIRVGRIPDKLIIVGAAIGLILSVFNPGHGLLQGLMVGTAAGLVMLLVSWITKGGLGLGDVKLFGCIGIYLDLESTASAMLIAAILSGLFSLVLVCINGDNKKRDIPFAPFITAGTLAAILL